jgi:hypothetical protein
MKRAAPTFKAEMDAEHCREIEAAIENGKAKGKLPNGISTSKILAALNKAYLQFQMADYLDPTITDEHRERWTRIKDLYGKLATELEEAKEEDWFFPKPPITEPVSDIRNMRSKDPALHAREMEEVCRRHAKSLSDAVAARKGGKDQARENFFQAVLRIWEIVGGVRVEPSKHTPTGGPMAHFFFTVVRPIFGADTPALSSLAKIVKRGRSQPVTSVEKKEFDAGR